VGESGVLRLSRSPEPYRYGKAVLAAQDVHQEELAADDGIGQSVGIQNMGFLLAPGAVHTGIPYDHIIPKVA